MASPASGNGEASIPMSRADDERALDVVYMWMAERDVDPERPSSIYCLSQVAQACKTASAVIMPRIEATILVYEDKKRDEEERCALLVDFWEECCFEPYEQWIA